MYGSAATCARCGSQNADMAHMFWTCPEAQSQWQAFTNTLTTITGRENLRAMETGLLGLFRRTKVGNAVNRFIDLALLITRRAIAMNWKDGHLPSLSHWFAATLKWGKAESVSLSREEACGPSRIPIALEWDTLLHVMEVLSEEYRDAMLDV
ncbi:hypothetical protein NDU88_008721 [Pleurodeles waltl]|uniref:Reverse transcriptase zinc-binding domain-containing protein n=1 Tax=Pleurodeles waltl TaxID=8319 RepID=A0AAV7PV68_PLEWA|nr:hypothetical protein NDU88_008721 [Pleurodeles waltl]